MHGVYSVLQCMYSYLCVIIVTALMMNQYTYMSICPEWENNLSAFIQQVTLSNELLGVKCLAQEHYCRWPLCQSVYSAVAANVNVCMKKEIKF